MRAALSSSIVYMAVAVAACGSPSSRNDAATEAANATDARSAKPVGREVEVPSGAIVAVRLDRALSTVRNRAGHV